MGPVEALSWMLMILGMVLFGLGWISILRRWFEESILLCGVGFIMPVTTWIYAGMRYHESKGEFWCQTAGLILMWGGIGLLKFGRSAANITP